MALQWRTSKEGLTSPWPKTGRQGSNWQQSDPLISLARRWLFAICCRVSRRICSKCAAFRNAGGKSGRGVM